MNTDSGKEQVLCLIHKPSGRKIALWKTITKTGTPRGKGNEASYQRIVSANPADYFLANLPDNVDLADFVLEVRDEHV